VTLPARVAALDAVAEAFRGEYKAIDGAFYLDVGGIEEMPAVVGLKKSQLALLDEKKTLKAQVDAFGATPEEVADLRKKAEGKGGGSEKVTELEAKLAQVSTEAQKAVSAAKDEVAKAVSAADTYYIEGELAKAAGKHGARLHMIGHELREGARAEKDANGKYVRVAILGPDGQPRIKDAAGNPYSLEDRVLDLKKAPEWAGAFEPDGQGGSGATPPGQQRTNGSIDRNNPLAWGQNAEKIAKGEVTVS
jgi:hypothetical protein